MMNYLSKSGSSLLDIVLSSDYDYARYKQMMFRSSQAKHFEPVLDRARQLIWLGVPGSNTIRYLLHIMNNKILKLQWTDNENRWLSGLNLKLGCIPFDTMPFATSLIQHNPETVDLFESIESIGREYELMARYIQNNMSTNARLYTPIKELEEFTEDVDSNIVAFNNNIYIKHEGRKLERFGQSVYIKESFDNTKSIIEKLVAEAASGLQGYRDAIIAWMNEKQDVDCAEKREILCQMFEKTHVSIIYGAAGTGKTYLINHVSQFWDSHSKLFLANTNPAVENLRRKVKAQNYRTKDEELLTFWKKVRKLDDDVTEHIVANRYASNLGPSVFDRKSEDEIILCLNYDGLYGINNINKFLQENNPNPGIRWGLWTYKVGDPILFNESERFAPVLYNNLKGVIVGVEKESEDKIWFTLEIDKAITELDVMNWDIELLDPIVPGKSVIKFYTLRKKDSDNDETNLVDETDVPFQIAYAVSIHKAQGLEYDSVKIIITEEVDRMITHNIFYTAITRSKRNLTIYWSPETQEKVINNFEIADAKGDATVFAAQTHMKMRKIKD